MERQTTLRDMVSLTANQVPGDEHALIQPGDNRESISYDHIASAFQPIPMTGSTTADIYTMRLNDNGEIIFVIDGDVGNNLIHTPEKIEGEIVELVKVLP